MNSTISPALEALIGYLDACGGQDRFELYDAAGEPDPIAARGVAEGLRKTLGSNLDVLASVAQTGNRVLVTRLGEPASL
jgi:hypothetical protein